jgi:hypothetical protein
METGQDQTGSGQATTEKRVKVATLQIQFMVESDQDAIAVKAKINDALAERPNVRVNFTIVDQHGPR